MAYTWAKVYIEILDDHKMGRLPDGLWRRVIELILLAKKNDKDGYLPGMIEMSWTLRIPAEQLEADLEKLAEIKVVEIKDGCWYLTNFVKRQAAEPVVERVRNFRKREVKQDCNDDVTQSYQTKTRLDTDKDIGANAQTKPSNTKKIEDNRSKHAAIIASRGVIGGRFPPKELWDKIISTLGESPDTVRLGECRKEWLDRGYNPNSWKWATEWYETGIPSRSNGNGARPKEQAQPKPAKVYR